MLVKGTPFRVLEDINNLIDPNSQWIIEEANDINNKGQIIGYGINPNGETHAFLLNPVPEPTTLSFLLFGTILFKRRR